MAKTLIIHKGDILRSVEFCIGIILLVIVTVGGILVYSQFATAIADRRRIVWARSLNNVPTDQMEKIRDDLNKQKKHLQKERMIVSGHRKTSLDIEINECDLRIKIITNLIDEHVN